MSASVLVCESADCGPEARSRLILIIGIDSVREKTLYQSRWLAAHGWVVRLVTHHRDADSIRDDPSVVIEEAAPSAVARIRQTWLLLGSVKRDLHHVELYPGGRFAFIHALLCRLRRVRLITVERGDLLQCQRRAYPLLTRLSVYACYRLSQAVWYREPYMRRALDRWRIRGAFMLANAVPIPDPPSGGERPIDFLWVNRVIPERHPDWFAEAIADLSQREILRTEILGLSPLKDRTSLERSFVDRLGKVEGAQVHEFEDPTKWYHRSRFFVLPADIVFANFALLEAMSYGVVPIVTAVEGTEEIVIADANGIVVPLSPEGLKEGVAQALAMSEADWLRLSAAARETIETRFSLDAWGRQLLEHYAALS